MEAVQGEAVQAPDGAEQTLILTDINTSWKVRWYVKLTTAGTIKIATEVGNTADAYAWQSSDVIPPFETISNKIFIKCSDASQIFVVTATT